jgi:hypothetical protein
LVVEYYLIPHSEGEFIYLSGSEGVRAAPNLSHQLIVESNYSKISFHFCEDCRIFHEGVKEAIINTINRNNMAFGHNMAFGLAFGHNMAFGCNLAFGRYLAFGPITAFGHNLAFGLTTAFGHNLAFALTMAFGRNLAFGHNLAFGLTTAFGRNLAFGLNLA